MIHVTIDAKDTQELHQELRALLAGESGIRTCWQMPPMPKETASGSTEEAAEVRIDIPDLASIAPDDKSEPEPDFTPETEPEPEPEYPKMEDCRAVLNALRAKHGPGAVRTILTNHGVDSFTELDACEYTKVMREAKNYEV